MCPQGGHCYGHMEFSPLRTLEEPGKTYFRMASLKEARRILANKSWVPVVKVCLQVCVSISFIFIFCVWEGGYCQGGTGYSYIAQSDIEFLILLPPPPYSKEFRNRFLFSTNIFSFLRLNMCECSACQSPGEEHEPFLMKMCCQVTAIVKQDKGQTQYTLFSKSYRHRGIDQEVCGKERRSVVVTP